MKKSLLLFTALVIGASNCPATYAWNPFTSVVTYAKSYFNKTESKPVVVENNSTELVAVKPSYTDYVVTAYRKTASFISWLVHRKCTQEKDAQMSSAQERIDNVEDANASLQNKCRAQEIMLKRNGAYIKEIQKQGDTLLLGIHEMRKTLNECKAEVSAFNEDLKIGIAAINTYFQSQIPTAPADETQA